MFTSDQIQSVTAPLKSAKTLPSSAYTSEEVFSSELQNIFRKEWICVAREDQVPEMGDYRSVDLAGQPLIIARQADGSIQAMSSICPHRSMPVIMDHGNSSQFQCPYHLWKFALNGKLISAPYMDGVEDFPPENCSLKVFRIESWEGFIFVNLDPEAAPLTNRLAELNENVGGYKMRDMVVASTIEFDCPWNWKLLVENFMEAYHHIGTHSESVQPNYNAKDSYTTGSIADGWSVLHMPEVPNREQEEDGLPAIKGLNEKQKTEILASAIMPNFAWLNTPSMAFWYQLQPTAHNQMKLEIHTLLPREIANGPGGEEIAKGAEAVIQHIHIEDIEAVEGPWKGLNAPMTEQGKLSLLEESIWQINQWWAERIFNT